MSIRRSSKSSSGWPKGFGIPVIRVPYERTLADLPLFAWAQHNYHLAATRGIVTPEFVGRAMTGVMTAGALTSAVQRLRPGRTELMVHPGFIDDALRQLPTRLLASRETEVALLTSSAIDRLIAAEAIRLASHDLQTNPAPWKEFSTCRRNRHRPPELDLSIVVPLYNEAGTLARAPSAPRRGGPAARRRHRDRLHRRRQH